MRRGYYRWVNLTLPRALLSEKICGPENRRNGAVFMRSDAQLRGFFSKRCFLADNSPHVEGLEHAPRARPRRACLFFLCKSGGLRQRQLRSLGARAKRCQSPASAASGGSFLAGAASGLAHASHAAAGMSRIAGTTRMRRSVELIADWLQSGRQIASVRWLQHINSARERAPRSGNWLNPQWHSRSFLFICNLSFKPPPNFLE